MTSDDDGGWRVVTRRRDKGKILISTASSSHQGTGTCSMDCLEEIREVESMEEDPGSNPYLS